eukprot:CAMPEP_0116843488 /NCGR_PEP_ID=MMETSP0418-20121206/12117_1 /TAXON_ID=1158023 /ORGANISM="Astrosyne radiata, Strain 13vi08-1A" /LENGTH=122 /DNA_ID=CAMNT_0004474249 /DNA_START=3437 /DNA_END=3808 /DNA_ORIENTATION=-
MSHALSCGVCVEERIEDESLFVVQLLSCKGPNVDDTPPQGEADGKAVLDGKKSNDTLPQGKATVSSVLEERPSSNSLRLFRKMVHSSCTDHMVANDNLANMYMVRRHRSNAFTGKILKRITV